MDALPKCDAVRRNALIAERAPELAHCAANQFARAAFASS
jgi:hypothetical protein